MAVEDIDRPLQRYQRQICLPEIGESGQRRLMNSKVLCVGAGGLGSPALLYLAAAGVATIAIADSDQVEESNLQRQVLFSTADIGQNKAGAAKRRLLALNPSILVSAYPTRIHATNALKILDGYDLVIDATDNFGAKFLINDTAYKLGIPVVYGSIFRFEGQVSVFWGQHGPCYRCLVPKPPASHIPNCAEAGVVGALAGIVGTFQAIEAIKTLLWEPGNRCGISPLLGRLLLIDTLGATASTIKLSKNPSCPVCTQPPAQIKLTDTTGSCAQSEAYEVNTSQLQEHSRRALIVDVREPEAWAAGHIPGAVNIPLARIRQDPSALPRDRACILYCHSGIRSKTALGALLANGFVNVKHLRGGLIQWNLPLDSSK